MSTQPVKAQINEQIKDDPRLLILMSKLIQWLPRGKGYLPRLFGRIFHHYFSRSALVTRHGARLKIAPDSLDFYSTMLTQNKSFDYWVFDTCRSFIKPKDVFYDIGANVGYMSIEMGQCVDKNVQIYSFEAQQDLAINIAESADLNGFNNVSVFHFALTDELGEIQFIKESHSIHGHISKTADTEPDSVTVDAYTIDYLVDQNIIAPPNVIKIDVEGAEHKVLLGMREVITKYKPIIVFEISKDTYEFDSTPKQIVEYLSDLAEYSYFWAAGSYREEIELTEQDLQQNVTDNKNILCYVN